MMDLQKRSPLIRVPNKKDNWGSGGFMMLSGEVLSSTYSDKHNAEIVLLKFKSYGEYMEELWRCVIDSQLTIECIQLTKSN
jgi:hypothetical protein